MALHEEVTNLGYVTAGLLRPNLLLTNRWSTSLSDHRKLHDVYENGELKQG